MSIILNLIILIIPFLLILIFRKKILGLLIISTSFVFFHLFFGFVFQLLHIFEYETILVINLIAAIFSLIILYKKKDKLKKLSIPKINPWLIIGFIIIIFQLLSVHYFHSGTISTINGYKEVTNSSYLYPYFSDEWIGVSFVTFSIENNTLPTQNPLVEKNPNFTNPLIIFFSFLAKIFLSLKIEPMTGYPIISIFFTFIICSLSFLFLRINKIGSFISILIAITITYITNSGNLPGFWFLLPYTMGIIMFLLGLISISYGNIKLSLIQFFLSIIFYTPIMIFALPIIFWVFFKENIHKKTLLFLSLLIITTLSTIFLVVGIGINNNNLFLIGEKIIDYIIRPSLDNGIPNYNIGHILPLVTIPFIPFGLIKIYKEGKIYLLIPIITGLVFWFFYSFVKIIFVIEYPRVIIITSLFLVISSGFGINWLYQIIIKKIDILKNKKLILLLKIIIFLIIISMSFFYTKTKKWSNLTLKVNNGNKISKVLPAAPINHYLQEDDINLFKEIKNKNFIAPPWKGLVVGVATKNYPLDSKTSIISNKILSYQQFMSANCISKNILAKDFSIDYVYGQFFDCDNFNLIGISKEGLYLFEFIK